MTTTETLDLTTAPWRQGRDQPRTLYARTGGDDWKADTMLGVMFSPELAAEVCAAHNAALERGPIAPEPVTIRMADYGEFFATREGMREIIAGEMDPLPPETVIEIDWEDVEAVTGAFISEYAAWFIPRAGRTRNRGMNDEVRQTYELACGRLTKPETEARCG